MNFLSIHDGHTATACFMRNGQIISLVSEERFTNTKNQSGFPSLSLEWILSENSITLAEMDAVVFPHLVQPIDYSRTFMNHYSYRHLLANLVGCLFPSRVMGSPYWIKPYRAFYRNQRKRVINAYCSTYNISRNTVYQLEHHDAHRYAAIYGSGLVQEGEPILAFTLDGSGDGISSTVARWDAKSGHKLLSSQSSYHSLGDLYSFVTKLLGMRPGEHEYKIMGMAPYVDPSYSDKAYKTLKKYVSLNDIGEIVNTGCFGTAQLKRMRKDFKGERFDNIANAAQRHFEDIVLGWIKYWINKTSIHSAVFGGGCFMNSKANMLVAELPELRNSFFLPSCGDESTALGAVYHAAEVMGETRPERLRDIYKGPSFKSIAIELALEKYAGKITFRRVDDVEKELAQLLVGGNIVGRFEGRSEWGARALGNRSILCRADKSENVFRLNKAIKMRDFWMPFAASVLEEDMDRYLYTVSSCTGSYMTMTYRTKPLARNHLIAGLHQYDHTCRAQIVSKDTSPSFHRLLMEFKNLTGIGGILNTSFNLHGLPIVGTPESAITTLVASDMDYLFVANYLIQKKDLR